MWWSCFALSKRNYNASDKLFDEFRGATNDAQTNDETNHGRVHRLSHLSHLISTAGVYVNVMPLLLKQAHVGRELVHPRPLGIAAGTVGFCTVNNLARDLRRWFFSL